MKKAEEREAESADRMRKASHPKKEDNNRDGTMEIITPLVLVYSAFWVGSSGYYITVYTFRSFFLINGQ